MRKRLLSFVLAVLMIVCLFPVQQASAYSDAYSLPSLTGNQAVDTANIAKSQLGYTYDGGTVYGAWWNGVTNWGVDYTQAGWCAIFVCWCANKAGAGLGIAYDKNGASPGYLFDWLKNNARYDTSFSTAPQAGDFIFFGNSSGGVEHVAVVTGYDASAGRVYLVGGNQGNGVGAVTSSSCRWASGSTWGSQYILGYGRPNYGGGTVTPDPDPGLSVKETITCKRTIKLPERVVNLYSNPTDTTRLTYFDYGPTVYSSRYAVMSDGSIMYEVGANHQGQDIKAWLKYESDMTVTKQHTYGSTQYESAHPHRGYRVCECGDKTYTGETTTRDDCSECGGEVKYAVEGGYLTFDKKTGTVTDCDSSVTKANIPHTIKGATVTCIGNGAFGWCKSLTGVTIPDSVTSIGGSAFYGCTSLTSVTIPDSVTSIGGSAFGNCKSLTNMTIPDSVTLIGNGAFLGCTSLTSVTIPDSVTSIGERAFSECTSLTSVTIPDSVTSIGEGAFYDCSSLTSVTIPDSVTLIGNGAFLGCTSLTSVTIPDSVTSIGERAFSECTSLTSVTIPDSVTSIGNGAFASCTSLTGIWVAEGNNDYSSDASGVLFNKDKITLVQCPGTFREYTIPDSVTSIGEQAFMGCSSLTSVTIPDSVTSIHWGAFYDCTSLTSVTIPDSVTSIGAWAFRDCTSLTDVYYAGSEAQWKAISISSNGNDDLLTANIHYNYVSHTHSYKDVVTAPTCTEKGYTTHTCACGDSYVDTYVDALGHAWDNGKVTKEPTETETGVKTFTCTRCGETKTETIPKLTHEHSYDAVVTAPTCTAKGYTTHTCACGDSYVDTYVDALGHAWDNGKVTKEPTETETGVKTFTCTRCGETKTETIPKLTHEHNYNAVVTAPTCTEKGYTTHTCACGDSYVDSYVLPLGHDWGSGKVTKEPTATENGIKTYICARCGETKTETIPKLTHEHSYKAVVTAPTCTAKGYTTHTCSCGDSYVDTYTDALGHAWDEGKVTKPATETEDGVKTFTCTRCGETKTETIPATGVMDVTKMFTDVSHSWADDGIRYCVTHQLMSGIGNDLFGPKLTTTRAQIVQILYNLEGEPKVSGKTPFTDLTNDWYQDAVLWAYQTGVVAGTSSTTFEPDLPVTREQIAVILMEYVTRVLKLERTWTPADLSAFPDAGSVSDWAKDAMADAVALGLISGASNGGQTYLEPQGSATREQVATILMEFCKNVKK